MEVSGLRWLRRWWWLALAALAGLGVVCGLAQESRPPASSAFGARRVASVALRPYGWMTHGEIYRQNEIKEERKYKGWLQAGPPGGVAWRGVGEVTVNAAGQVFVGLPIWASGAAPRSALRGEGDRLRVVVVDSGENGKPVAPKTMDFPTVSLDRLDLRLAGDGALLVFAGDKLMRLDADGKTTAELTIPNEQKEFEVWDWRSSTTGRIARLRQNKKSRLLVDTQTLTVLKRCAGSDDDNDEGEMTDDMELMSSVETPFPDTTYGLEREVFCQKRERLAQFGNIGFVPAVVDDNRLLALTRDSIALKKIDAATVWTTQAPIGRSFETYEGAERLSRDMSRVAIRMLRPYTYREPESLKGHRAKAELQRTQLPGRSRPRTRTLELEDGIEVLDVASGRVVARVPIQEMDPDLNLKPYAAFALSPDGHLLAVLQDGLVEVWHLD